MNKEIMIADTSCYGYWYKGTWRENCTEDSNSIGIGSVSFVLVLLIVFSLIFKKVFFDNGSNMLEKYIAFYNKNKDESASIANSYITGSYLIIKDKNDKLLEEIKVKDANYDLESKDYIFSPYRNFDEFLDAYVDFYNKKNNSEIVSSDCRIVGEDVILCNSKEEVIFKIDMTSAKSEFIK